jgi:hypothetical protein
MIDNSSVKKNKKILVSTFNFRARPSLLIKCSSWSLVDSYLKTTFFFQKSLMEKNKPIYQKRVINLTHIDKNIQSTFKGRSYSYALNSA